MERNAKNLTQSIIDAGQVMNKVHKLLFKFDVMREVDVDIYLEHNPEERDLMITIADMCDAITAKASEVQKQLDEIIMDGLTKEPETNAEPEAEKVESEVISANQD